MWKIVSFLVINAIIFYISRASLRLPRSHGFYRFFAWEFMLTLFLVNVDFWFYEPLAWNQMVGWILLFSSLIPLTFGVRTLISRGKPTTSRKTDSSLLAFEKTTQLVTSGIYKYIRHPLYSSLFLLTWGIFFKHLSMVAVILAIAATIFLVFTARADETECTQFFGAEYQDYMKHTKRFIPFLF
jgi:protein-S-isoprenylcysteine O-methyltransferase Ste14